MAASARAARARRARAHPPPTHWSTLLSSEQRYAISFRIIIHTFKKTYTIVQDVPKKQTQKMFSLM